MPLDSFHPAVANWFRRTFPVADAGAGRRVAGDPLGPQHADRGADRLGQDAGRVPRGDRRSRPTRRRAGAAGRDRRRLRVAAEGAVERRAHQSRSADRRHPRRAAAALAARRRDPHDGAHRRHAAGRSRQDAQAAAAHRRHDAGIALHPARLGVGPAHAVDDAHGHRRRSACARAEQARQPSGAVARTARCAVRAARDAHRAFGDAEADRGSREVSDGVAGGVAGAIVRHPGEGRDPATDLFERNKRWIPRVRRE